jgi:hypothetical protein
MAKQTRQPSMIVSIVFELRVIGLGQHALLADKNSNEEQKDTEVDFPAKVQRRKGSRSHQSKDSLCAFAPLRRNVFAVNHQFAAFGIALMWLAGTGLLPNVM